MLTIDALQPFGYMTREFQRAAKSATPPGDWTDAPGFEQWIESTCNRIADAVWPRWDGGWKGNARATAVPLTVADLKMIAASRSDMKNGAYDLSYPESWWFAQEDAIFQTPWDERLKDTGFRWCAHTPAEFSRLFEDGNLRFSESVVWMLKWRLQRPRALHLAYMIGADADPPAVWQARSAWSPSAISGHAYEGLVCCTNVFINSPQLSAPERDQLLRLAVDIGDRRVLAGVHLPSDNAMSWFVALEASRHLGIDASARKFMIDAIRRSRVFEAMRHSPAHAGCVDLVENSFT